MSTGRTPLADQLATELTLYDAIDDLFGTRLGETLNELLIKGLMDFFDEGQSVWSMPGRRQGLYRCWTRIARRNRRLRMRGLNVDAILAAAEHPEDMIDHALSRLGIPESLWMEAFQLELTRLHGWAGFVRWRSQARHYYWQQRNPADLIDFLAIRLVLALALIEDAGKRLKRDLRYPALKTFIEEHPQECLLRRELNTGLVLPEYAHRVELALDKGDPARIEALGQEYERERLQREARTRAERVLVMSVKAGISKDLLLAEDDDRLRQLIDGIYRFKEHEGYVWTQALERTYTRRLLADIGKDVDDAQGSFAEETATDSPGPSATRNVSSVVTTAKSGKVQALFCIDVRSERLRRQLETLGDYDTYGIAGFFGIPVAFIELGKGHEAHLCPAIVTPGNVAVEMPHIHEEHRHSLFETSHEVVHDLKNTVLAPYITVEAVGLLFGFDMLGKTFLPGPYSRWRKGLDSQKRPARILIDKIDEEEARELIQNLQDELVVRALEQTFNARRESLTGPMIAELRDAALGNDQGPSAFASRFGLKRSEETAFLETLREDYGLNPDQAQIQFEHLAKIGFHKQRQAQLVATALRAIGLIQDFGRTVLVVGHGSTSDNNPYESALDCGACGGEQGLVNARIFAAMANGREVRGLLATEGIAIPDDTWFVPVMHDTTTDTLLLHDLEPLPAGALTRMTRIQEDLDAAGRLCALERCRELDEHGVDSPESAARRVLRNATDWTQVRPEWGLSKNASFVIGRRCLTRQINLDGRAFLHSYDYRIDPKGRLLETILSGPLVVAQWINMEHYFSVVDNEAFGSGSKVYHNVTGRFGVISGNLSDLRTGLPAQTMSRADGPYHQPMRLITLIEAPRTLVESVLARVFKPRELVHNGWIRLVVLDPEAGTAECYERDGWQGVPVAVNQ